MPDIGRFKSIDTMADFVNYQSPYVFADNSPMMNIDEDGLGILNVIGNLFKRLANGIRSIGGCDCKRTQESVAGAWNRPDFPKLNEAINDLFSKGPGPTPPPSDAGGDSRPPTEPIDKISPSGISMNDDPPITGGDFNIKNIRPSISEDSKRLVTGRPVSISIRFESNSELFKSDPLSKTMNDKTLSDLVKTLIDYPQLMLLIQGNVSNQNNPTWQEDTTIRINNGRGTVGDLQLIRARAIKRFLVKRGIEPARLSVAKGIVGKSGKSATIKSQ